MDEARRGTVGKDSKEMNTEYIHYTKDGHKTVICGYTYWTDATDIKDATIEKNNHEITCPVCLKLLKQERAEQLVNELLGGADSV